MGHIWVKDHPRCPSWTLDFSPRFDFPLSPRSIFHTSQRFLLPNHVTSGCLSPRFFLPLVSGFEPAIPLATNGQRLHFRLATARTNQKPEPDPSEPPLLLEYEIALSLRGADGCTQATPRFVYLINAFKPK